MINIALDIWENKLKIPREKGKYSFEPIPGTNIILIKSKIYAKTVAPVSQAIQCELS